MTFDVIDISDDTKEIIITFIVPEKDFIYKDFITCSAHEPIVTLSAWKADKQSIGQYDPAFKETKQVFNETFSISMIITTTQTWNSEPIHLYCSYYRASDKKINHALFTLFFSQTIEQNEYPDDPLLNNELDIPHKKNISSLTSIDDYFFVFLYTIKKIMESLKTEPKVYIIMLLLALCFLILISYFLREQLQRHTKLREVLQFTLSLLIASSTTYALLFLHTASTPFIAASTACVCTFGAGLFYTKKSTNFQSGYLRTLCTFIGMLLICSAIFLLFKGFQYANVIGD